MSSKSRQPVTARFKFGKNWQHFLPLIDEERISEAERSICSFLGVDELKGKTFLDIGSGSGLFSLAARRLGAVVLSFDVDVRSVECAQQLKRRYFPDDPCWRIEQASILDSGYVQRLGRFDVCYAWGVLHHTNSLWQALYNAHLAVAENGFLFIGVYNDQGVISAFWEIVKKTYCADQLGKALMTAIFFPLFFLGGLVIDVIRFENPANRYRQHKRHRGMSLFHDWKDWLGGFPYEPARPDRIIAFLENLGFELRKTQPTGHGFGNNQFLFQYMRKDGLSSNRDNV
jgi:2-polyprenyl-6-hydroxyphenyl methylase/3-demethylubiquinone-9 3-methyltransferase